MLCTCRWRSVTSPDNLPRRLEQARQPAFLFGDDALFALHALEAVKRLLDFRAEHRKLGGHRQQLVLKGVDAVELALGVADERCRRVSICVLIVVDLGAPRQLIVQLVLDIGQHAVEAVDPRFDLLDELQPGGHAVRPGRRARSPAR